MKKKLTYTGTEFDIKLFAATMRGFYEVYYNSCNYGKEYARRIKEGEAILRDEANTKLLVDLAQVRHDIITSDRECAALAVTYEVFADVYGG